MAEELQALHELLYLCAVTLRNNCQGVCFYAQDGEVDQREDQEIVEEEVEEQSKGVGDDTDNLLREAQQVHHM